ncbi:MAG: hypothetical protein Ct9H90mP11_09100 [Acidimicrobiales bacterium]|nr:MAG: hypothetical protein Ct9H90mP11_09100 [Acidimicrobiales bacterium]
MDYLNLRDLFRGVRRFEQLRQDLGIAKNILSDRLSKLDMLELLSNAHIKVIPYAMTTIY